jgi:hypothetical protein
MQPCKIDIYTHVCVCFDFSFLYLSKYKICLYLKLIILSLSIPNEQNKMNNSNGQKIQWFHERFIYDLIFQTRIKNYNWNLNER